MSGGDELFSKTPPVEDGWYWLDAATLNVGPRPIPSHKIGNQWETFGYIHFQTAEEILSFGWLFGPRISPPQPDGGELADREWLEAQGVIDRTKGKPGQGELAFYSWPLDENQGNDECWISGIELLARPLFAEDETLAIWNPTRQQVRSLIAALSAASQERGNGG